MKGSDGLTLVAAAGDQRAAVGVGESAKSFQIFVSPAFFPLELLVFIHASRAPLVSLLPTLLLRCGVFTDLKPGMANCAGTSLMSLHEHGVILLSIADKADYRKPYVIKTINGPRG